MENNLENLTIGVFAKAAGVNVETIRFYQRKGLLPEPDKPYGSIRRYGEADVTRVRFVKSAQRLGFSLDEIAELLRLEDGTHCEEASGLAEHKLKDVREKMADLARMEAVLSELVCACHARKGNVSCPLIASLQDGTKLAASALWISVSMAVGEVKIVKKGQRMVERLEDVTSMRNALHCIRDRFRRRVKAPFECPRGVGAALVNGLHVVIDQLVELAFVLPVENGGRFSGHRFFNIVVVAAQTHRLLSI